MKSKFKNIIYVLFFVYLALLIKIILFKNIGIEQVVTLDITGYRSYNLIPFETIKGYFSGSTASLRVFANTIGNIIIFMPLGYLLPLLFKEMNKLWKVALIAFGVSIIFELLQYVFSLGSMDVDDVILNTLGGVLGYTVYIAVKVFIKQRKKLYITTLGLALCACILAFSVVIIEFSTDFGIKSDEDNYGSNMINPNAGDDSKGLVADEKTKKNVIVVNGSVEEVSDDFVIVNEIYVDELDNGASTASEGIEKNKELQKISIKKNTNYEYMLITQNGKILEKRSGSVYDLDYGRILEVLGYYKKDKLIAQNVIITEIKK